MNKHHAHIIVLEPSTIVYEGISNILLQTGNAYHIFKISDWNELIESSFKTENIDIIIVNPQYLHNNFKEFQTQKKTFSRSKWIGLVYAYFDTQTLSVFDAVINITDSPQTIHLTIRKLLENEIQTPTTSEQETLSEREIDVLKQLTLGLSNKEIADKLNISIHTVISHRKNITDKTGIKSTSGLTIYAISNNIISLDSFQEL